MKANDRLGLINKNKHGTEMKIIDVLPDDKIIIQFQDKFKHEKEIHWNNFKNGNVKNPYDITVLGHGYIGEGKYPSKVDYEQTLYYTIWINMMKRCYITNERHKHKGYGDCTVCEEWLNFQVFAAWCETNYYDIGEGRMHLDKDILIRGNRVYSPDACMFLPQRINMIFMTKEKGVDIDLPNAIRRCKTGFQASYNGKSLGVFKTVGEAIEAHEFYKRIHIKQVANEYKEVLPPHIYDTLMRW